MSSTPAVPGPAPNADPRFVGYYTEQSASPKTLDRFSRVRDAVLRARRRRGAAVDGLDVVDVGCGAGTQSRLWARAGHSVTGVDISAPLIEVGRKRALDEGLSTRFLVGSATRLDLPDASADVVLLSELLEHIDTWQPCIDEAVRVLRPGGTLFLTTTNVLCPKQQEFDLPAYSWYPGWVKRRCERMSLTTHKHWVQYTSFPAVHWFSFYQLRDYLAPRRVTALDRFDLIDTEGSALRSAAVGLVKRVPPLRWLGHVLTPYTAVVGFRRG